MSEGGEDTKKNNGKSSVLVDSLFGRGFLDNAGSHLYRAIEEIARGATEQANEHLKRARPALARALISMTSPRLSEQENEEFLRLQREKYRIEEDGFILERDIGSQAMARLRFLGQKALPPKKEQ